VAIASCNSHTTGRLRHGAKVSITSARTRSVRCELVTAATSTDSKPTVAASSDSPLNANAAARRAPKKPASRRDSPASAKTSPNIAPDRAGLPASVKATALRRTSVVSVK